MTLLLNVFIEKELLEEACFPQIVPYKSLINQHSNSNGNGMDIFPHLDV